jgi:hypothetical protein
MNRQMQSQGRRRRWGLIVAPASRGRRPNGVADRRCDPENGSLNFANRELLLKNRELFRHNREFLRKNRGFPRRALCKAKLRRRRRVLPGPVQHDIARRDHQMVLVHDNRGKARLKRWPIARIRIGESGIAAARLAERPLETLGRPRGQDRTWLGIRQ